MRDAEHEHDITCLVVANGFFLTGQGGWMHELWKMNYCVGVLFGN